MGRKYMILIATSLILVALDQMAKIYVHSHFDLGESVRVIPDYFNLTYVRNMGAAFGIFRDSHEVFRHIFFLSIPPIAVGIIVYFIYGLPEHDLLQIFSLSSIAGGAMGNYIDRVRFGYVIDFLDFHIRDIYSWPAFNIADSAIVVGVAFLSLILVREYRDELRAKKNGKVSSAKN